MLRITFAVNIKRRVFTNFHSQGYRVYGHATSLAFIHWSNHSSSHPIKQPSDKPTNHLLQWHSHSAIQCRVQSTLVYHAYVERWYVVKGHILNSFDLLFLLLLFCFCFVWLYPCCLILVSSSNGSLVVCIEF